FSKLAGDRQPVVASRRPSLLARLCMGLWALLVRLFGITVAMIVLATGVAAIGFVLFLLVRELGLPTPSHDPVEVPELQPAEVEPEAGPVGDATVPPLPPAQDEAAAPLSSEPPVDAPRYEVDRAAAEPPRLWRSADRRFSQEAVYVGFDAGIVRLRRTDSGEVIEVELEELSDLDKKIVAARLQSARHEAIQRRRAERAAEEEAEEKN
ncbi:MAG: SHD1 domain-containing protein, partial [Planctomycetota bacterium]